MSFDWNKRKSCCGFSPYEKVGMLCFSIQLIESMILAAIVWWGIFTVFGVIGFLFLMKHLEENHVIEISQCECPLIKGDE